MSDKGIIFMGTSEFAVTTLNALVEAGMDVRAVVTAPDRPAGRGRKLRSSAVKERAKELVLPVLQPERLKAPDFQAELESLNAALFVVVAFRMLPESVWSKPRLGTVNLHASLLPQYRGAAPINWAVANGEKRTGVTTFLIQHAIDTGDILLQEEITIGAEENAGDVHDRLMNMGADLMVRTVEGLFNGTIQPTPQREIDEGTMRIAPKLDPRNTRLDPSCPAQQVHDLIRGMSPYPGAWCEWHEPGKGPLHCKVFRSRIERTTGAAAPGTLRIEGPRLFLACADGWLEILELQMEGRKRMTAADLLRGLQRTEGSIMK